MRCTLDGRNFQSVIPVRDAHRWLLCRAWSLSFGPHQLNIQIDSADGTVIWFDTIEYWSMDKPNLANQYSQIVPSDTSIRYFGRGWKSLQVDQERYTYVEGSGLSLPFYGLSFPFWPSFHH